MQLFGLTIQRTKAVPSLSPVPTTTSGSWMGGWFPVVREAWPGAWQDNVEVRLANVLTHPTVFACISLIASDIAKMRLRLVELDRDGIWTETDSPAYSPVLRKPNHFQTRIQFFKGWLTSKLVYGNTYVLKERNERTNVSALYVLDPTRVRVLVAPNGEVYYELIRDDLALLPEQRTAPASEIIHDTMHALYHPLCGLSPIHACGLAATLGLKIQTDSALFFENNSTPGGILTAPGAISQEVADRIKETWETNYGTDNRGRTAVLGDGLKFEPMTFKAQESQVVEQWQKTAEAVAAAYHVPAYLVGAAPPPAYNNIEALTQAYYSQCLQELIESIELLLDEGLGLTAGKIEGRTLGTEFDLDDLLRMDSATMVTTLAAGVGAGIAAPNEARKRVNQKPVEGGDTPYLQQQYWPIRQLAERDIPVPPTSPAPAPAPDEGDDGDEAKFATALWTKVAALDYAP